MSAAHQLLKLLAHLSPFLPVSRVVSDLVHSERRMSRLRRIVETNGVSFVYDDTVHVVVISTREISSGFSVSEARVKSPNAYALITSSLSFLPLLTRPQHF